MKFFQSRSARKRYRQWLRSSRQSLSLHQAYRTENSYHNPNWTATGNALVNSYHNQGLAADIDASIVKFANAGLISVLQAGEALQKLTVALPNLTPPPRGRMGIWNDWKIPDKMEPVEGFRAWKVAVMEGWGKSDKGFVFQEGPVLQSLMSRHQWSPDAKYLHAKCGNGEGHTSPHMGCDCGIWAVWENNFDGVTNINVSDVVTGTVKGWGKVIVASKGFRAENMRVTGLFDNGNKHVAALAERYGVPLLETPFKTIQVSVTDEEIVSHRGAKNLLMMRCDQVIIDMMEKGYSLVEMESHRDIQAMMTHRILKFEKITLEPT